MLTSFLTSLPQYFAAGPDRCYHTFFGLPPWYKYLELNNNCEVVNFNLLGGGGHSGLLLVALAIVDILLRLASIVALVYVLWGGFNFITGQAEPDKIAQARHTIINALIGLGIALLATSLVVFIGNRLAP